MLSNITILSVNTDRTFSGYYEKIAERLKINQFDNSLKLDSEKYYVQKIKLFFTNGCVYYEVTLTVASNKINKFDVNKILNKCNLR